MEAKDHIWLRSSLFWLLLFVFIFVYMALSQIDVMVPTLTRHEPTTFFLKENSLKGYFIKTPGCTIPSMNAFDHTITKCIFKEKRPICNNGIPPLFASNLTSIYLLNDSISNYTDNFSDVKCCYKAFFREDPKGNDADNNIKFSQNCILFETSATIMDEFINVICWINKTIIYTDLFSFVPVKGLQNNLINDNKRPLNVLIIGIDAVSRLNFHRQMPKTVEFLQNNSAIELLGYNKVGDNTFPNLMPFLTGFSETELERVCWNEANKHRFDKCPFIWKDFKAAGYVTSFGEDASWMGIFNYMRKGFSKQPTDYMWGAFDRYAESTIGNSHNMNVDECIGSREVYKVFLDYISNFVTTMNSARLPFFAFFWGSSLSHDYLNKPALGDQNYYNFFKNLKESAYLENTVTIVMSDHGIRWGDIRQTYQGQMEERLPFIFFLFPDWFKNQYLEAYSNVYKNSRRLTTPYDMHETLKDIINYPRLTHDFLQDRKKTGMIRYSLFDEISSNRTCKDANIDSHWCTCQQSIEIPKNDSTVLEIGSFVVDHINKKLENYAECSVLSLKNISDARIVTHNETIFTAPQGTDYMIIIETLPGDAVFEITVRKNSTVNNNQFKVMGTISRLNLYGDQSACILDFHLKLYCFCKSLLEIAN